MGAKGADVDGADIVGWGAAQVVVVVDGADVVGGIVDVVVVGTEAVAALYGCWRLFVAADSCINSEGCRGVLCAVATGTSRLSPSPSSCSVVYTENYTVTMRIRGTLYIHTPPTDSPLTLFICCCCFWIYKCS